MAIRPKAAKPQKLEVYDELAGTPARPLKGWTYTEAQELPDDYPRYEVIDGELIVSPAPATRHQQVVAKLTAHLLFYAEAHGGQVLPGPFDVYFEEKNYVEPDLIFVTKEHVDAIEERYLRRRPPDVVVEVSSPSTRRLDVVRKRDLYERFKVPEYWYVDIDSGRVEIYRLKDEGYPSPLILRPGEALESPLLPGFSLEVGYLLD